MVNIHIYDYFDFLNTDDIRIKGTRMGIETVLTEYLNAMSPEEIAIRYPTVTLEQVYATITFYLHNQQEVEQYLSRWQNYAEAAWQHQQHHPSPAVRRVREIKRQRRRHTKAIMA